VIKSIQIENFRSIKSLFLTPKNLTAFVGANSVGKTNVLKAIDLVLGEGWTTKAKVVRELFHDTSQPINIEIEFNTPIKHYDNYKGDTNIYSIKLEMKMFPEFVCEVRLYDNNGNKFYINDSFKKNCHFIYIPSDRDLTSEMRVSNWTLLGKLMKEIHLNYIEKYNGNEESLRDDFKIKMTEPREFLEADFSEKITFKKFSDCFIKHCSNNSKGFASALKPELSIYNLNWFYKTLQIAINETGSDKVFDSEEVGSGMQNLILISIFQTYAELMGGKVIFGIEEPEIYLYPHAQRALYNSFKLISETSQILYTTHNPNFIDASRAYEIEMLRKSDAYGTYNIKKTDFINEIEAKKVRFKIYTHFNTERNELFFANKILLVEGDSDKIFFKTIISEIWGIDIEINGISIIDCSGKQGVAYFSGLCKAMGIEKYFSIWDSDDKPDELKLLSKILVEGKGIELHKNLEDFLSTNINKDLTEYKHSEKVRQAFQIASSLLEDEIPSEFDLLKAFIIENSI
jgi:predicted ATP-dependent endonuclease of OLD family